MNDHHEDRPDAWKFQLVSHAARVMPNIL
jgi:hypothetical protein